MDTFILISLNGQVLKRSHYIFLRIDLWFVSSQLISLFWNIMSAINSSQAIIFIFQDQSSDIDHHLFMWSPSIIYYSSFHSNNPSNTKYISLKLTPNHLFKYLYILKDVNTLSSYKMWNLMESNYNIIIPFMSILEKSY